jgi:threonine/homoserine/homoserine lactone efflux protein
MSDDLELAALLGEAPRTPDPGFRFDVLARTAERARRRRSRRHAFRLAAGFALIGVVFPLLQAFGVTISDLQPLLLVAAVLGVAYVLALMSIEGPSAFMARSRAALRRV